MRFKMKKRLSAVLLLASLFGFTSVSGAATTFTLYHNGTTQTSESTDLNALGNSLGNGDVFTLYSNVTSSAQFSGNPIGEAGKITIQSGTAGTQYTITNSKARRLIDYAHGTYVFKDIRFYQLGIPTDGGGVLYRNDGTSTALQLENVLVEDCVASSAAAFRAAVNLTISGTYTLKNNANSGTDAGAVTAQSGKLTLSGDASVGTFTGTKNAGGATGYDLYAGGGVFFTDAGTYTLGGGINSTTLSIDKASVTLEATSKSKLSGAATVSNAGTLTLGTNNFSAASLTLNTNGKVVLTSAATIQNLAGDATGSVSGTYNLTVNSTADSTFNGTLNIGTAALTKTGGSILTLSQDATAAKTVIQAGVLYLRNDAQTPVRLSGDIYLDGGTLKAVTHTENYKTAYNILADNAKLYMTAAGGTLDSSANRAYITNGVHSETGVQSGNLILSGGRQFISGTSTFNGYFEIQSGVKHFSNEAVASSKGIILSGGTLQFMGETLVTSTKTLSCPIFIKGNAGIQCGWGNNFYLNGTISDWEGVTGKQISINPDGTSYVWLNGLVNTTAYINNNGLLRTNGTNDMTLGGLVGGTSEKTFVNSAAADTGKKLTLNIAPGATRTYSGTLTGLFNLVKDGTGTQVFSGTGIGSDAAPLNSVTVSAGTMQMTGNAPIYTKSLTVGKEGTILFGTGKYAIDADTLSILGDAALTFASDTDYTHLNIAADTNVSGNPDGIFEFVTTNGYAMNRDTTYQIADLFPDLGTNFNYDSLLKSGLQYEWNLVYNNGGLFLSMDANAVPEPASWALLLLGVFGVLGVRRTFRKA